MVGVHMSVSQNCAVSFLHTSILSNYICVLRGADSFCMILRLGVQNIMKSLLKYRI